MAAAAAAPVRVAILRDPKWRGIIFQVFALLLVCVVTWYLFDNTRANLEKRNIGFGLDFLDTPAGFDIIQSLVPYTSGSTYGQAFVVSLLNTLLVAAIGIAFATILGFTVGVARLSSNWLVARLAAVYVETFRNVPLLLQIFFWYHAVLKTVPGPRQSLSLFDMFFLNNRGVYLPAPLPQASFWIVAALFAGGVVTMFVWQKREDKRQELTGERRDLLWIGIGLIAGLPVAAFLLLWAVGGSPLHFDIPALRGFNFAGGIEVIPELMSLVLALVGLHRRLHRRECPLGHPGGQPRPDRGRLLARHPPAAHHAPDHHTPGAAGHHSAADQPVSEPDQELFAGGCDRLSGPGRRFHGNDAEPDRPGGRNRRADDGHLPAAQPAHLAGHELVQRPRGAG